MKKLLLLLTPLVLSFASGFSQALTISSVSPMRATYGTTVTITGTGFTGVTAVEFGGTPATSFTVASETTITATVGSGASGTVTVISADSTASLQGFVFESPQLVLTKVSDGAEGAADVQFRISYPSGYVPSAATTVRYEVGGSALSGADFEEVSGTVIIPAGINGIDLQVDIINDEVIEPNETIAITLSDAETEDASVGVGPPTAVTATIGDNDNTGANNTISLVAVGDGAEPSTDGSFRVSFPAGVTSSVPTTVSYAVAGTATEGSDYSELNGSITIPAGSNSADIVVAVANDDDFEDAETVQLTLQGATNTISTLTVADQPAQVRIADDDQNPANTTVTLTKVSDGAEGDDDAEYRVSLSSGGLRLFPVVINYRVGGSATPGTDHDAGETGTITIPPLANSANITIRITNDRIIEPTETITLTITSATYNGTPLTVSPATAVEATITDNDNTPANNRITLTSQGDAAEPGTNGQFRVSFPEEVSSSVTTTITYSVAGSARAGEDYTPLPGSVTIPAGQNGAIINLVVVDDTVFEGDETVELTLEEATNTLSTLTVAAGAVEIAIEENEEDPANNVLALSRIRDGTEGGNSVQFRVSFPQGITKSFVTNFTYTTGGTASAGTDFGTVSGTGSIPSGANSTMINIPILNDRVIEDSETIILTLTVASSPITVSSEPVSATIADDDNTPANNRITVAAAGNSAEPGTGGAFRVSFPSEITSSVATTVTYRVGGTASETDYSGLTGSVEIPANTNSVEIEMGVEDDKIIEGTETVTLTLMAARNTLSTLTVSSVAVSINITDDDNAPPSNVVTLAKSRDGSEALQGPQFTVSFPAGITSAVATTVNYSVAGTAVNGTDFTRLTGIVTIPANQNSALIDVPVINDEVIEAGETVLLAITAVSSTVSQFSFSADSVGATISDNDNTARNNVITLTKLNDGAEAGDDVRFSVSYPEGITSSVGTTVTFALGGTASIGDFEDPGRTVTIPAGSNSAEILVDIIDDQEIEVTETVALTLSGATSSLSTLTVRPGTSVIANIADNDSSSPNTITLSRIQEGGEPSSPLKFRVSFPSGITSSAVTVVNYSVGGTATPGQDYLALPGSVIIPAGRNSADIDIAVIDDEVIEPAEAVELTLGTISNSLTTLTTFPATAVAASISDDDIPQITKVAPLSAGAGSTITITGAKFDPDPGKNIVYFGPVKGMVAAATPSSLTVTVPEGATYQSPSVTVQGLTAHASSPFTVTFPNSAEVDSRAFDGKVDLPVAEGPTRVLLGDFNSDQRTDLLTLSPTARAFSLLENSSSAGGLEFRARKEFPVAGQPRDGAVADLDGDGNLDVIIVTSEPAVGAGIYALRNASADSIWFEPAVDLPAAEAVRIAVGDLNGDGKPDLVVSESGTSRRVSIFRNTSTVGTLAFESATTVTTGDGPIGVVIADLNGDQLPDLAVANSVSNTVSVFPHSTTGSEIAFLTKVDVAVGTGPSDLVVGDWDQDGKLDLAVANVGASSLSLLRNTASNGGLTFAGKVDVATGAGPSDVTAGDLNGDGKADLVSISANAATISLHRNSSTSGTIAFRGAIALPQSNVLSGVALADLNGDSKPDLAFAAPENDQVTILQNMIDQPVIKGASPLIACVGSTVTLTGSNFTGATSVTFGDVPASSFTVVASGTLTAVVPPGASGDILVTTPRGTASITGFSAIPIPAISANGSTTFASGGSVVLTATTGPGFSYLWQKDGADLPGATSQSLTALESGSYRVRILDGNCGSVSEPVLVQAIFTLPAKNFTISATSETCRDSDNGVVTITAAATMDYTATISGNGINLSAQFTESTEFNELLSGNYSVCISVPGHPEFKQCFEVVITEPEDLAVYTAISPAGNSLDLVLRGSDTYYIELNGERVTARQDSVSLPLRPGANRLKVSTGKECQGVIERVIYLGATALVYPNPFENVLNVNLGNLESRNAAVEIRNSSGMVVYSGKFRNDAGTIQMNVPELMAGIYFLKLSLDGSESIYKIIRK